MPLRSIVYASEARAGLTIDDVDDLARAAARFNIQAGVTGVLLHDGTRFMQYVEGPDDGIAVVYSRILTASSHREIVELGRGQSSIRRLPYWAMRLCPIESDELRRLLRLDWTGLRCHKASEGQPTTAMFQLFSAVVPEINA
ncbi:BLUF domain-containing protein [Stenotrophomonas maltophilia]|uniref:BLUF domain-containing protein n=1 Tax=Stenotrophomonas maltophilia group TaxID=995085 RepID=UPI00070E869E|nr:BLUF domain-containing protein [Stenotrophomonas maltophilia]KRG50841.1 hypothetical protein ARC02_16315 [Stenotrophomonas maltophilia]NNH47607.1 BLUF domain-containing protein [Stenotrophomonas maltophilia]